MYIGDVVARTKLPAKTIRYYEDIGLVKPGRGTNGYRDYDSTDVHRLSFVQRARRLGFSLSECRQLIALHEDGSRASADVKRMAEARIAEIDREMAELAVLREALSSLADACHGDDRPDCPILDDLAGDES